MAKKLCVLFFMPQVKQKHIAEAHHRNRYYRTYFSLHSSMMRTQKAIHFSDYTMFHRERIISLSAISNVPASGRQQARVHFKIIEVIRLSVGNAWTKSSRESADLNPIVIFASEFLSE